LEGDIDNLEVFYNAGVRMAGPLHLFDNELGGSGQGIRKNGLTAFGKQVVRKMDSLGMIIDLAHASEAAIDDIIAVTEGPLMTSHTGAKAICNNGRNLSDRHLKAIAKRGGIIGIAFFKPAMCKADYAETARTMRHVADLVGVEHVALGSDFDGAVSTPTDIRGLHFLVRELRKVGFNENEIRMIMGENAMRFWLKNLP
jgi:microsomal dipeptidase-like Zn-dependent dipeptidase